MQIIYNLLQNDVYYSFVFTPSTAEEFSNAYLESTARNVLEVTSNSHNTEDLTVLFNETCTNILYNHLISLANILLAPLKPKVFKSNSHPWFNHHTRVLRWVCHKAERQIGYKFSSRFLGTACLFYQCAVKTAKIEYFSDLISKNVHDPKLLFNTLIKWSIPRNHHFLMLTLF